MDLAKFDLEKAASAGIQHELVDPQSKTGEPLLDKGKPIVITAYGRDSKQWQQAAKQVNAKMAAKYKKRIPVERVEESLREVLAECTIDWTKNVEFEGKPLECNKANALMLYNRLPWIAEQVLEAVSDRGNYFLA